MKETTTTHSPCASSPGASIDSRDIAQPVEPPTSDELQEALEAVGEAKPINRPKFVRQHQVLERLARLPASERGVLIKEFAKLLACSSSELKAEVRGLTSRTENRKSSWRPSPAATNEARDLLEAPDILSLLQGDLATLGVAGETNLAGMLYLTCISVLTSKPFHILVKASSSSGKSFVSKKVLSLVPPDRVLSLTEMSPKALYHLHEPLTGKILFTEEIHGLDRIDYLLRILQSEGELTYYSPIPAEGGGFQTLPLTVEGPLATISTTTRASINPENETRLFELRPDESPEQTHRINSADAERLAGGYKVEEGPIIEKWRAAFSILDSFSVLVPYATFLASRFPSDQVRHRRDWTRFRSVVQCVTLLHQRSRRRVVRHGEVCLVAEPEDFEIALRLARRSLEAISDSGQEPWQQVVPVVKQLDQGQGVSRGQVEKQLGASQSTVNRHLTKAVEAGCLEADSRRQGVPTKYRWVRDSVGGWVIPTTEELKKAADAAQAAQTHPLGTGEVEHVANKGLMPTCPPPHAPSCASAPSPRPAAKASRPRTPEPTAGGERSSRAGEQVAGPEPSTFAEPMEAFEERAAIIEFEAGLSREAAEHCARESLGLTEG